MDKDLLDYTTSKVDEMLAAPSASAETKSAAQAWKDAIANGSDADAATNTLLDAISEHQTSIDDLIAFAGSDAGKQVFGEEGAAKMLAHSEERKKAGAMFCDCAASSLVTSSCTSSGARRQTSTYKADAGRQ